MIFSNFSPIYSNNHTVNIARHKLPDMVTYAMLAAQRIAPGSTLLGETTNPGWNERFPAGLVAQALLPVLAIAELIMSARAGPFRKPCRMNTYEKRGGWGPILQGHSKNHVSPQLPRNHILVKKVGGHPPRKLMQHLKFVAR